MSTEIVKSQTGLQKWQMLYGHDEIKGLLNPLESEIVLASIRQKIKELPRDKAIMDIMLSLQVAARNVDYQTGQDWTDKCKGLAEIILKYFDGFTIKEINLAFEYLMVGMLDEYLPLNSQGQPDRKHYNKFGIEYISRVLKAYLGKKNEVIAKIYNNENKLAANVKSADRYCEKIRKDIYTSFLQYKYTGQRPSWPNDYLVCRELTKVGLIQPVIITEADEQQAVKSLLKKARHGLINEFVEKCIRHLGTKHSDVESEAFFIAQRKAINRAFDEFVSDEIQLNEYLLWSE